MNKKIYAGSRLRDHVFERALTGFEFKRSKLSKIRFNYSVWNTSFEQAELRNVNFFSNARNVSFKGAHLKDVTFFGSVSGCDFTNARFTGVEFQGPCTYSTFERTRARYTRFKNDIKKCIFTKTDLRSTSLIHGSTIEHTQFHGADLRDAYISGDLNKVSFMGADLRNADLIGARGIICFDKADIRGIRFAEASLSNSTFYEAWIDSYVPAVKDLDRKIYNKLEKDPRLLDMTTWGAGSEAHRPRCLGGWAVVLAGLPAVTLQKYVPIGKAAALIYIASEGFLPNFYENNVDALKALKRRVWAQ